MVVWIFYRFCSHVFSVPASVARRVGGAVEARLDLDSHASETLFPFGCEQAQACMLFATDYYQFFRLLSMGPCNSRAGKL